jgi:hypothetical protein
MRATLFAAAVLCIAGTTAHAEQALFLFGNGNQMTNANMSGGIIRGTITYIIN